MGVMTSSSRLMTSSSGFGRGWWVPRMTSPLTSSGIPCGCAGICFVPRCSCGPVCGCDPIGGARPRRCARTRVPAFAAERERSRRGAPWRGRCANAGAGGARQSANRRAAAEGVRGRARARQGRGVRGRARGVRARARTAVRASGAVRGSEAAGAGTRGAADERRALVEKPG